MVNKVVDICCVMVGLPASQLKEFYTIKKVFDNGDTIDTAYEDLQKMGLEYCGAGYETDYVDIWKIKRQTHIPRWEKGYESIVERVIRSDKEIGSSIFGVVIATTRSGAINMDELTDNIQKARELFKEITGKDGKLIVIGEQV